MTPKVSVIVPVYKVPLDYLRECFDSLLAQTMQECEFIVVSDGAPDAECSVCEEYADKDSRFKFFRREHAGVSATRNFGISQAQGEFITFVDSDDWVETNYISQLYAHKNSDVVFFPFYYHINKKRIEYPFPSVEEIHSNGKSIQEQLLLFFNYNQKYDFLGYTCNKLFKNSLIKNFSIQFSETSSFFEDEVFTLEYCKHIKKIDICKDRLYNYRINNTGLTLKAKTFDIYQNAATDFFNSVYNFYSGNFKEKILEQRVLWFSFCALIKKKTVNFADYKSFYESRDKINVSNLTSLTLKIFYLLPNYISYALFLFYKKLSWLPFLGIK